jgi:hypothetical protein
MEPLDAVRAALAAWRSALTGGGDLVAALRTLDALHKAHLPELDPQLAHFLERRSYEKAERWIASGGTARHLP